MGVFDDIKPADVDMWGTPALDAHDQSTLSPYAHAEVNPGTNPFNSGISGGIGFGSGPVQGGFASAASADFGIGQFEDTSGTTQVGAAADAHMLKLAMDPTSSLSLNSVLSTLFTSPSVFDDIDVPLIGDIPVGGEFSMLGIGGGATASEDTLSASGGLDIATAGATVGTPTDQLRVAASLGESLGGRLHYGDSDGDGVREMGFGADIGMLSFDFKTEALGQAWNAIGGPAMENEMGSLVDPLTQWDLW